jgi:hypothetical protein
MNDLRQPAVDSWVLDVGLYVRFNEQPSCIHLLPVVDASDSAMRWCEGGDCPTNNLPPQVQGLARAINDPILGCKEWTVSCAACKGCIYSSFTPNTVRSGPANRCQLRDSVYRMPRHRYKYDWRLRMLSAAAMKVDWPVWYAHDSGRELRR